MKSQMLIPLVMAMVASSLVMAQSEPPEPPNTDSSTEAIHDGLAEDGLPTDPRFVLDQTMARLDGTKEQLGKYKGRVILIVNTASRCGLTPQYEGLEALYRKHKDEGFVILGFPANDFGKQEPGTNLEIAQFCEENYKVSFPMFSKITVLGKDKHPLYKRLTAQPEPIGGEPRWNFTKFLVDHEGRVVARFEPRVAPDDPRLVAQIETMLEAMPAPHAEDDDSAPSGPSNDH